MNKSVIDRVYQTLMDTKLKLDNTNTKSAIKKYFISHVLSQSPFEFQSELLEQNLFSVSAYGSQLEAFKTEVDSYKLPNGSTIIVHPFLPINCVDYLVSKGFDIISSELDYDTLSFNKDTLNNKIINREPKLYIHFTINQLLNEVTGLVKEFEDLEILVVDDSKYFNQEFFRLIDSVKKIKYIKFQDLPIKSIILKNIFNIDYNADKVYFCLDISPELLDHTNNKSSILIDNILLNLLVYQLDQTYNLGLISKVKNSFLFNCNPIEKNSHNLEDIIKSLDSTLLKSIDDVWFLIFNIIEDENVIYPTQLKSDLEKLFSKKRMCLSFLQSTNLKFNTPKSYLVRDSTALQVYTDNPNQLYQVLISSGYQFYKLPTIHPIFISSLTSNEQEIINQTLITLL